MKTLLRRTNDAKWQQRCDFVWSLGCIETSTTKEKKINLLHKQFLEEVKVDIMQLTFRDASIVSLWAIAYIPRTRRSSVLSFSSSKLIFTCVHGWKPKLNSNNMCQCPPKINQKALCFFSKISFVLAESCLKLSCFLKININTFLQIWYWSWFMTSCWTNELPYPILKDTFLLLKQKSFKYVQIQEFSYAYLLTEQMITQNDEIPYS